jgi:HAD superfamily hydrolase (TIGR01509 family)
MPRAVLFDFDGVLADTANVHVAAWERTFQAMGLEVAPEDCLPAAEVDDRAFLARVFETKGVTDGDLAGWVRRKLDLSLELLADEPRLYPGAVDLVEELAGRARLGVVSTAWRPAIEVVLRAGGLLDRFELIVAKEDVTSPKPDPAPYLLALERLGLTPAEAVALEDSPTGLASARAAGVPVVAVGHRRPAGEWSEAASAFLPGLKDRPAAHRALGV